MREYETISNFQYLTQYVQKCTKYQNNPQIYITGIHDIPAYFQWLVHIKCFKAKQNRNSTTCHQHVFNFFPFSDTSDPLVFQWSPKFNPIFLCSCNYGNDNQKLDNVMFLVIRISNMISYYVPNMFYMQHSVSKMTKFPNDLDLNSQYQISCHKKNQFSHMISYMSMMSKLYMQYLVRKTEKFPNGLDSKFKVK